MEDEPRHSRRLPTIVDKDGELTINPSRYSRKAIALAFDMMGGVDAFADWAEENKTEFYTKLFTKIVGKEVEIGVTEGVESLLDMLDDGVLDNAEVIDAEFEVIEDQSKTKTPRNKYSAIADVYAESEHDAWEDEEDED